MNLEFSIDKKTGAAIAACVVLASVLLVLAGYLLGAGSGAPASSAALPAVSIPGAPPAAKSASSPTHPAATASAASAQTALSGASSSDTSQTGASQPAAPPQYCLQFGSFRDKKNAQALVKTLKKAGVTATVVVFADTNGQPWYVVRSGSYAAIDEASQSAASLRAQQNISVLVRRTGVL